MRLSDVEKRFGKLKSIVLSEIESREYARFTSQPLGLDLKVFGRNSQAGVYANGEMNSTRYTRNAYVSSIIVLGNDEISGGTIDETGDGSGTTVELGFMSKYTKLGTDCETPKGQGDNGGHVSTYCKGFDNYRVHIYDTAKSMEITVESEVARKNVSLASQSLGFDINSKQIEWRFKDGKPFAVIMRADVYRLGSDGLISYPVRKTGEMLVVKGLPGFEQIDYKVNARTNGNGNQEARRLADEGFSKPNNTAKTFQPLDIAKYNRPILNASRRDRKWVKSPMQVAVRLAGEISETRTRTMEFQFPSAESADEMTLTVTNDGLLDDSVKTERFVFYLKKNASGVWTVNSAQKAWSCHRNRGHQDFSAVPCN